MRRGDPGAGSGLRIGRTVGLVLATVFALVTLALCQGHRHFITDHGPQAETAPAAASYDHTSACATPSATDTTRVQRPLPRDAGAEPVQAVPATDCPRTGVVGRRAPSPPAAAVLPHGWNLLLLLSVSRT